ncbi:hypothetical protein BV22DRAFT_757603 [Leucogyrophana mollusca]|uniref:Uncharacterized protein n=1 Tax=Leucogyrophana mollusca TaxID=85980 RepID=A0ACB8B5Y8_9AGAM|nr:hypothetical protein BV22DRAFT_757603 [Leucogyrophana mollusca]
MWVDLLAELPCRNIEGSFFTPTLTIAIMAPSYVPLGNVNERDSTLPLTRHFPIDPLKGEPLWAESCRYFLFDSWFNVLLVFVPLSFVSHSWEWDVALRFSFSFLAIIPLAKVC